MTRKRPAQRRRKRILVFGTFDLLHPGHRSFLRQAKKLGSELIVAVGRDRVVRRLKNVRLHENENQRRDTLARLPTVSDAVLAPANPARRYVFIAAVQPDIIALGYDQSFYTENLEAELRKRGIRSKVVRLRPYQPKRYKSSILRQGLARLRKI